MEGCAAVCVPLLQAATLWQVENRIRRVECIIPCAYLQLSDREHMAFPDTECLQNVSNPLRAVCLPLFKASPLWDGHFKIVRSGISSVGFALVPECCFLLSAGLQTGALWLAGQFLWGWKSRTVRIWVCRYCKFCNRNGFRKTTLKHLFLTCNCCQNCFHCLSSSTYYLRRLS